MGIFKKKADHDRVIVETVRPIEIPVVTAVKQCLAKNDYGEAVRYGFQAALYDFQRAHGVVFPSTWTNADVLSRGFKGMKGYLPQLFAQLYALYEPVRYGVPGGWSSKEGDAVGLLQSIYADELMWRLYAQHVTGQSPEQEGSNGRPGEIRLSNTNIRVGRPNGGAPMRPGERLIPESGIYVRRENTDQQSR